MACLIAQSTALLVEHLADLAAEGHPGFASRDPLHLQVARQVALLYHLVQLAKRNRVVRALVCAWTCVRGHVVLPCRPRLAEVMGRNCHLVFPQRVDDTLCSRIEESSGRNAEPPKQWTHVRLMMVIVAVPYHAEIEASQAYGLSASLLRLG